MSDDRRNRLEGGCRPFIDVGTQNLFRDEDPALAVLLLEAGVSTELHLCPSAYHAAELFAREAELSRSSDAPASASYGSHLESTRTPPNRCHQIGPPLWVVLGAAQRPVSWSRRIAARQFRYCRPDRAAAVSRAVVG